MNYFFIHEVIFNTIFALLDSKNDDLIIVQQSY